MTFLERLKRAWAAFNGDIYQELSASGPLADKNALAVFASIRTIIGKVESQAAPTWKDFHMALADILNTASAQIRVNTAAISTAVATATAPLNAQITALNGELSDATTAANQVTSDVAAQTSALTPTI